MRRGTLIAGLLAVLAAAAAPGRADTEGAAVRTRLLGELSSEAASVRDRAVERLSAMDELTADELAAALREASPRARPHLYRLAAARRAAALVPGIAQGAAGADAPAAEAAIRALVSFGPEAVEAGRAALAAAGDALAERERTARARHLGALDVQRRVEREVLSRWRRKGGSYRGRYKDLAAYGWDAQPVLLAMLLDIPLEDQFVVIPAAQDPDLLTTYRRKALAALVASRRRGYRTFEPVPSHIHPADLFELAEQALCDVADVELMQDVLRQVHGELNRADQEAGFMLRRFEESYATSIELILWRRGEPDLLQQRHDAKAASVRQEKVWLRRWDPDERAREFSSHAGNLEDLAMILHQMERYDDAAARYEEVVEIRRRLTGKVSSVAAYNRACALARAGREEEALESLRQSLDPETSSGSDDFTREWVLEDGDLEPLHDDPRFHALVKERFGGGPAGAPAAPPDPRK